MHGDGEAKMVHHTLSRIGQTNSAPQQVIGTHDVAHVQSTEHDLM
jgi:hypothetical protein